LKVASQKHNANFFQLCSGLRLPFKKHSYIRRNNVLFIASKKDVGLSYYFTHLAIAVKKTGNNVILISTHNQEEYGLFKEIEKAKIKHYKLKELDRIRIRTLITEAKKLGRIIDQEKVNVIHVNGFRHLLFAFLALKFFSKEKRAKIVVTIHSFLHGTPYEKLALLIEGLLINFLADLAMPVAKSVATKLIQYGAHSNKIFPVYNGVDIRIINKRNDEDIQSSFLPINMPKSSLVIGYFAKLIPRKGHKYLIKAFSKVLREFPNAKLVLTGEGQEMNNLK